MGSVDLACKHCKKVYNNLSVFLQHTVNCSQPVSNVYICSVCQLITNKKSLADKHCMQTHNGQGEMRQHISFPGPGRSASGADSDSRKRPRPSLRDAVASREKDDDDDDDEADHHETANKDEEAGRQKRRLVARRRQPDHQQQQQEDAASQAGEKLRGSSSGSGSSTPVSVASAAAEGQAEPPPPPPPPAPRREAVADDADAGDAVDDEDGDLAADPFDASALMGFAPITSHLPVLAVRCGDRLFTGDGDDVQAARPTVRFYQEGLQVLVAGHNLFFPYRRLSNIVFSEFGYNCLVGCLYDSDFRRLCGRFGVNADRCRQDWRLRVCVRLAAPLQPAQLLQFRRSVTNERRDLTDRFALRRLLLLTEEWSRRLASSIGLADLS